MHIFVHLKTVSEFLIGINSRGHGLHGMVEFIDSILQKIALENSML